MSGTYLKIVCMRLSHEMHGKKKKKTIITQLYHCVEMLTHSFSRGGVMILP